MLVLMQEEKKSVFLHLSLTNERRIARRAEIGSLADSCLFPCLFHFSVAVERMTTSLEEEKGEEDEEARGLLQTTIAVGISSRLEETRDRMI